MNATTETRPTNCDRCGAEIVASGSTTGYGRTADGEAHCFACCGDSDRFELASLGIGGRFDGLYLTGDSSGCWVLTNWPGTLRIHPTHVSSSFHNFAGEDGRRDVWFRFEGNEYHGVNVGNGENVRVRRVKA